MLNVLPFDKTTVRNALGTLGFTYITLWAPGDPLPADWPQDDPNKAATNYWRAELTADGPLAALPASLTGADIWILK